MNWENLIQEQCNLQEFRQFYDNEVITEWFKAYIDYPQLEQHLKFLKLVYDYHHYQVFKNNTTHVQITALQSDIKDCLENEITKVDGIVGHGFCKSKKFIRFKLNEIIYYWKELIQIILQQQEEEELTHEIYDKKPYNKKLIKIIYATTLYLKSFINLTLEIKKYAELVKNNFAKPIIFQKQENKPINHSPQSSRPVSHTSADLQNLNLFTLINQNFNEDQQLKQAAKYLSIIEQSSKSLYISSVCLNQNEKIDIYDYTKGTKKITTSKNYFLLGLYIGLGVIIFLSLLLLLFLDIFSLPYDQNSIDSMIYIFPMFRGVGLLILYLWGMAWNVYGFIKFKINFKIILQYGAHYSTPFQIMKRAGFFTLVFGVMLFFYLIGLQISINGGVKLPIEYSPFIVWILYFLYIFFPNRQVFNPRGRTYFYSLLKNILLSPFVKMSFLLSFASDQAVSFVTPIKDLAYTICFYGSSFTVEDVSSCLRTSSFDGIVIAYIVAIVPLLIRMVQCFNAARQSTGKFIGHLQMWNFLKYTSSVITSTLSFFNSLYSFLLIPFIISSIVSTLYSYIWDLKHDWGLLEKNSKYPLLRNNLCYKYPSLYYIAIIVNFIFRCSWTLTISPSVINLIPKSTFLPFLTGLIEIFRRCMWNFFRIQKQHVINCESFTVIKQKPEAVLKLLREKRETSSFRVGENESIINYVKVKDHDQIILYKTDKNKILPNITLHQLQMSKLEFMDSLNTQNQCSKDFDFTIQKEMVQRLRRKYF